MTYAKIIADSISPSGVRLTTMEVRFHRFVLAEFNTHRVFSRSSASSRAIPLQKQIDRLVADPFYPVVWPAEQKGMQGGDEVEDVQQAQHLWAIAGQSAINSALSIGGMGIHKSLANRLLEPFMGHTVVVTSTAWENFFHQRCHSAAQPEIRVAAEMMKAAYDDSEPQPLREGDWHLPYVSLEEIEATPKADRESILTRVSAARSARVSYLTQDGKRDMQADLDLYDRLTDRQQDSAHAHDPVHWAPLEHVATPWWWNRQEGCIHFGQDEQADHDTFTCVPLDHLPRVGNLLGWRSLRTEVEARQGEVTFR